MIVGQANLKCKLETLVSNNNFPRFSIFVGQSGSGRKLLTKWVCKNLSANYVLSDISVESVRGVIDNAYKCIGQPTVYVFADADSMSAAAKNALLKITEEPPKNAYFIITINSISNTLDTIRSRGTVFYMDPYSLSELMYYYRSVFGSTVDAANIISSVCTTPGEINQLMTVDPIQFYSYVEKVVDNVAVVSGANSFKVGDMLKFKDSDTGKYDLMLFFRMFMAICSLRLRDNPIHYAYGIDATSKYLQELRIVGINKRSLFDMWLLDIRERWM